MAKKKKAPTKSKVKKSTAKKLTAKKSATKAKKKGIRLAAPHQIKALGESFK